MVIYRYGDILGASVDAIVNPINCVGVMGKGLALQIKNAFPQVFLPYKEACKKGFLKPGIVLSTPTFNDQPQYIIHFPTKVHWKNPSKIEYIEEGLIALLSETYHLQISSIAIPPLGCGLGNLRWKDVHPLILNTFERLSDVYVHIYPPMKGELQ